MIIEWVKKNYILIFLSLLILPEFVFADSITPYDSVKPNVELISIIVGFVLTIVVEMLAGFVFFNLVKKIKIEYILTTIFFANLISYIVAFFLYLFSGLAEALGFTGGSFVILGIIEIIITIFEAYFIWSNHRTVISFKSVVLFSIIANSLSFALGLLLLPLLADMLFKLFLISYL
jgi:hypothetical protein